MTRYLVYNPSNKGQVAAYQAHAETAPEDVEPVAWGVTPEAVAARTTLLADLGLGGLSALPCMLIEVLDDQGGGHGWHEVRLPRYPESWAAIDDLCEAQRAAVLAAAEEGEAP